MFEFYSSFNVLTDTGGSTDYIYFPFGDLNTPSSEGLDFVNGMVWLPRFYIVYDSGNHQVGIAMTEERYVDGN